jgi:NTE family protein
MRAFVLGGGGAKGALQAGALRALLEAGLQPDLLVGTSIGAANAAFLATHHFSYEAVTELEGVWRELATSDPLPDNYLWLTIRALFNRPGLDVQDRIRELFLKHGLSPDVRFGDLEGPRLILVAADLRAGGAALYGTDPNESVLNGVLASTAIPP